MPRSSSRDDQGRYVVPDLPTANYQVWVRGFGLVDSAEDARQARPDSSNSRRCRRPTRLSGAVLSGDLLVRDDAHAAGEGLRRLVPTSPRTSPASSGASAWTTSTASAATSSDRKSTRTIPAQFGEFKSGEEAWARRVASGHTGEWMVNRLAGQLGGVPFKYFGEWTDRVAKGELPKDKPPRPQGVERNVVVTSWDWGSEKTFVHDLISSDRRKPTVNAYGPLFGSPEYSTDDIPILDPKTHKVSSFRMTVLDPNVPESLGRRSTRRRCRRRPCLRPTGATRRSGASARTTTTA